MFKINDNYLKLPGSYLFSTIAKKVQAFQAANPDKEIIRLGIGDVTLPLAPVVIDTLHGAVDEMSKAETFHGYAPDLGYDFLRNAIVDFDYKRRGADISADEIFVSDGAKSDSGNIGDIFSVDNKIAVCDPVYPVYVDTNAMAGRTGDYLPDQQKWSNVIYMPCTAETNFAPELPKETPDIIYLCFPNNPTGSTITKDELQKWVDYANKVGAVIIYDAAYEAYISEENVPHTIFECEGARTCAIELRSFSKNAGFTGTRLGFTVIPKDLKSGDVTKIAEADVKFHDIIFAATNNQRLITLLNNLREQMYRFRVEYLKQKECYPQLLEEHDKLIALISGGEVEEACELMGCHIDNQASTVSDVIRRDQVEYHR